MHTCKQNKKKIFIAFFMSVVIVQLYSKSNIFNHIPLYMTYQVLYYIIKKKSESQSQ